MSALQRMIRIYDRMMRSSYQRRYYENSGYFNFGYWGGGAASQREASEALVDKLASNIGPDAGPILDVACGLGASTQRLTRSWPATAISAINISPAQLDAAQARAPDCSFRVMDATKLDFPDGYFAAVICVEAAFHFDTRDKFLAEAFRVLKPGGVLVLSDILFRAMPKAVFEASRVPAANHVADISAYRARFEAAGYGAIEMELDTYHVRCSGEEVVLGPIEFKLLRHMLENPERVLSRDELIKTAWPRNVFVGPRTVDVHISRLRRCFRPFSRADMIRTVRLGGYALEDLSSARG